MKSSNDLQKILRMIDRKGYPAYKDTRGAYQFGDFVLSIDHVQGDPFASPSKLSVIIEGKQGGFPGRLYDLPHKRTALEDHLLRLFGKKVNQYSFKAKGSGKSGLLAVSRCGQEILRRSACEIDPASGRVLVRFEAGFPANGRTINSSQLIEILFNFLPDCVRSALFYARLNKREVDEVVCLAEDQQYIRDRLEDMGLCAFVANGSVLPRESGVSSRPMKEGVAFRSPSSMEVSLELPHKGRVTGMGIRKGITLIVGGGYHGKSTLLKALELGVYHHIGGDGREYVITDPTAMKMRAEDGRSIKKTDISMFINNLPNKKDTVSFYTEDASGSTSQAANVVEGMESKTSLLLIDEDTSATNFMIRDELMQRVVHRDQEPITPFIERARGLYEEEGISSIIVAGSSGSYFHIADCIVQMDRYVPRDITEFAKAEAQAFPAPAGSHSGEVPKALKPSFRRVPKPDPGMKGDRVKIKTMGRDGVLINKEQIDLRYLEQLVDSEQTAALGCMILYAEKNLIDGKRSLDEIISIILDNLEKKGFASILEGSCFSMNLAMPRKQEIFGAFNRFRALRL